MKEIMRYGFTLSLICIVASGLLSGVNYLTKPKILTQAQIEEEASLKEAMPEGVRFKPVKSGEEIIYYKAYNEKDRLLGVAFKVEAKGYSSEIETMVGMTKDGTITAIKILSQNETPGLGNRITEPAFLQRFAHKNTQSLNAVEAITGATMSSRAVIEAIKKKTEEIKGLIKDER